MASFEGLQIPNANSVDAYDFVRAWHGHGKYDWLIAVNQMRGQGGVLHTVAAPLSRMLDALRDGDLDDLVYLDGHRWNLYHSAGFLDKVPERGRRSGKNNIRGVPGVWLDLDKKTGSFATETDALDFLHSLPIPPTITVATGTGGIQGYWRCPEVLAPDMAEDLCIRWWQFASRLCDSTIDKVQNRDRILRLPGSVRWPKGDETPVLARLLSVNGPEVEPSELYKLTEDVHQEGLRRRREAYTELEDSRHLAAVAVKDMGQWDVLWMITHLEEMFNERYEWPFILEPLGWTELGEDYDGRTLWSRPGGTGRKSATTDWVDSPHVMSLFSDAEETGLRRLAEAGVALTKYRVYVELYWYGDEAGFVRAWVKQLQEEGSVGDGIDH